MSAYKQNINDIATDLAHNHTTFRKRLISQDEHKGKLATYNYAWLEKGKALTPHAHPDGEEFYYFLEGDGSMLVGEEWFSVSAGDFVTIPPKKTHSVKNDNEKKLVFMAIRTINETGSTITS